MADQYKHPFADLTPFTGDANAINAATKTALNTVITNIFTLFNPPAGQPAAHPDFDKIPAATAVSIMAELQALQAAVTAHA